MSADLSRGKVLALLDRLDRGDLRAAEPDGDGWRVNPEVQEGMLAAFRRGADTESVVPGVVPGARPVPGSWAHVRGLSISAAVIVKYRDARTGARTAREEALRPLLDAAQASGPVRT